jgi:hypothetical protein
VIWISPTFDKYLFTMEADTAGDIAESLGFSVSFRLCDAFHDKVI